MCWSQKGDSGQKRTYLQKYLVYDTVPLNVYLLIPHVLILIFKKDFFFIYCISKVNILLN